MRASPHLLLAAFALVCLPSGASARAWVRPVEGPLLRAFAVSPDRFAAGQHRGVDLAAPAGTLVHAACAGRVSFAGRVPRGGRTVSLRCGPLIATYQHLGDVGVVRGQAVIRGAGIGTVGHPRPRPHVHLSARVAATRAYVDPLTLLSGARRDPPASLPPGRRPPGLGPARAPIRPPALGPAPAPRPLEPVRRPWRPLTAPVARPVGAMPRDGSTKAPWPVWLGLALFGLGLPLGGAVVSARRRRRASGAVARTA